MRRAGTKALSVWVLLWLTTGCVTNEPVAPPVPARPGQPIPLLAIDGARPGLADPADPGWNELTEYVVETAWAPPVHPSIALRYDHTKPAAPVMLRVARDAERLYLRLRWSDATPDRENAFERFADAAAVQFALEGGITTPYMMGSPAAPVNLWFWRAHDEAPQNLAAGGFGSLTRIEAARLTARSDFRQRDDPGWSVVFSRPLEAEGEHQVDLSMGASLYVSLAVWDGAEGQRAGLKRTTVGWLVLQPERAGSERE